MIQHREAINCISLSLIHKSLRTKALVLELLAAICLVKGGHEIILSAFDNFKEVCHEQHRFQTLMDYFLNFEAFHIEFMVSTRFVCSWSTMRLYRFHEAKTFANKAGNLFVLTTIFKGHRRLDATLFAMVYPY